MTCEEECKTGAYFRVEKFVFLTAETDIITVFQGLTGTVHLFAKDLHDRHAIIDNIRTVYLKPCTAAT